MDDIKIQKASASDLRDIDYIYRSSFFASKSPNFSIFLNSDNFLFYVAKLDNKTVGFFIVNIEDEKTAHVLLIAVHPEFRRKKIGDRLMNFLINFLRNKGISRLYLEVSTGNIIARKFYEKLGFKIVDLRFNHYMGFDDIVDDVYIMELKLGDSP